VIYVPLTELTLQTVNAHQDSLMNQKILNVPDVLKNVKNALLVHLATLVTPQESTHLTVLAQ
jgi:hypothetical protein